MTVALVSFDPVPPLGITSIIVIQQVEVLKSEGMASAGKIVSCHCVVTLSKDVRLRTGTSELRAVCVSILTEYSVKMSQSVIRFRQ